VLRNGRYSSIDVPGSAFTRSTGINSRGDIVGDWIDEGFQNEHGYIVIGFGEQTTPSVAGKPGFPEKTMPTGAGPFGSKLKH
jgi:hypothetical protein